MPEILLIPVPPTPPVIPPVTEGADQVYVVPAGKIPLTPLVGVTVNAIAVAVVAVIAFTSASGFNVTVTEKEAPVQVPDTGVTM